MKFAHNPLRLAEKPTQSARAHLEIWINDMLLKSNSMTFSEASKKSDELWIEYRIHSTIKLG